MVDEIWGSEHRTYGCIAYSHSHFRPNATSNDRGRFEAINGGRFFQRYLYSLLHHAIDILYHLNRNLFFDDTFYADLQRKESTSGQETYD